MGHEVGREPERLDVLDGLVKLDNVLCDDLCRHGDLGVMVIVSVVSRQ